MKYLIIEDEIDILKTISNYLEREGNTCEEAPDYSTALEKLEVYDYDIVVLDITLPDGNGLDLLDWLKTEYPGIGVLIVSARDSLDDRLKGLDMGADDYITKPFHLSELNSRINAVIRRRSFEGSTSLVFNEIEINPSAREVEVKNVPIHLTRKEYDLLLYFIINKNRVLTKQAIAEHLWGDDYDMIDNLDFIYTHIKNLRKKIQHHGGNDYLESVYGLGYKFTDK